MNSLWRGLVCVSDVAKDPALLQVPKSDISVVVSYGKDASTTLLLARLLGPNKRIRTEGQTCDTPGMGGGRELVLVEGKERGIGADVVQVNLSSRVSNREDRDDRALYDGRDRLGSGWRAGNGREDGVDFLAKSRSAP